MLALVQPGGVSGRVAAVVPRLARCLVPTVGALAHTVGAVVGIVKIVPPECRVAQLMRANSHVRVLRLLVDKSRS